VSGKGLTDEGFAELVEALVECLSEKEGVVRLEELSLRDCKLTAASLASLSKVVSLAAGDLRDLDLSSNQITIATEDQISVWHQFLESFKDCDALSRIDLSGNPLGPKAFEVFAKIYMQSDMLDFMVPSKADDVNVLSPKDVNKKFEGLGIGGSPRGKTAETPTKTKGSRLSMSFFSSFDKQPINPSTGLLSFRDKSPEKLEPVTEPNHHKSTRGLRSVPYIVFRDVQLTDTSALHLSTVLKEHLLPANLLPCVPYTPRGASEQRFEEFDRFEGACRGLMYLPNPLMSGAGYRVLYLADALRNHLSETLDEALEFGNPERPLDESAEERQVLAAKKTTFKKARAKIEGDAMKSDGFRAVELWDKAMKMLILGRALLLEDKNKKHKDEEQPKEPPEYTERFPELPHSPPPHFNMFDPTRAAFEWNFESMYAAPAITEEVFDRTAMLATTPQRRKQSVPSNARKGSVREPSHVIAARIRQENPLLFQVPEAVWSMIIARAVGAEDVLSARQQLSVVRYARDWKTLMAEREYRGKPDFNQWWNVLDKMGCLSYEGYDEVVCFQFAR
jgi:hypothetical protein